MRINREQFNKWIKALKSGKYKQTTHILQDEDGYCCLGLACRLLIPEKDLILENDNLIRGGFPIDQPSAPNWLKEINEDFKNRSKEKYSLSHLNDNKAHSFKDIASILVKTYPERKKKNVSNKRVVK